MNKEKIEGISGDGKAKERGGLESCGYVLK